MSDRKALRTHLVRQSPGPYLICILLLKKKAIFSHFFLVVSPLNDELITWCRSATSLGCRLKCARAAGGGGARLTATRAHCFLRDSSDFRSFDVPCGSNAFGEVEATLK